MKDAAVAKPPILKLARPELHDNQIHATVEEDPTKCSVGHIVWRTASIDCHGPPRIQDVGTGEVRRACGWHSQFDPISGVMLHLYGACAQRPSRRRILPPLPRPHRRVRNRGGRDMPGLRLCFSQGAAASPGKTVASCRSCDKSADRTPRAPLAIAPRPEALATRCVRPGSPRSARSAAVTPDE